MMENEAHVFSCCENISSWFSWLLILDERFMNVNFLPKILVRKGSPNDIYGHIMVISDPPGSRKCGDPWAAPLNLRAPDAQGALQFAHLIGGDSEGCVCLVLCMGVWCMVYACVSLYMCLYTYVFVYVCVYIYVCVSVCVLLYNHSV